MIRTKFIARIFAIVVIGFCLATGCGKRNSNENPYVGNMDDLSYSGQWTAEGCVYRGNALGEQVCVAEFEGQFVWADYAAPWCQPCRAQARVINTLERELGDQVIFLTIITSEKSEFQSAPTQQTANSWAHQFELDPAKVIFADNLWGMTIPTHILFSPTGQTLYRSKGYLSKEQIQSIMADYMRDWQDWSDSGKVANWMNNG